MITLGELRRTIGISAAFVPIVDDSIPPGIFAVTTHVKSVPTTFILAGERNEDNSEVFGRIEQRGSFFHAYEGQSMKGGHRTGIFLSRDFAIEHFIDVEMSKKKELLNLVGAGAASLFNTRIGQRIERLRSS